MLVAAHSTGMFRSGNSLAEAEETVRGYRVIGSTEEDKKKVLRAIEFLVKNGGSHDAAAAAKLFIEGGEVFAKVDTKNTMGLQSLYADIAPSVTGLGQTGKFWEKSDLFQKLKGFVETKGHLTYRETAEKAYERLRAVGNWNEWRFFSGYTTVREDLAKITEGKTLSDDALKLLAIAHRIVDIANVYGVNKRDLYQLFGSIVYDLYHTPQLGRRDAESTMRLGERSYEEAERIASPSSALQRMGSGGNTREMDSDDIKLVRPLNAKLQSMVASGEISEEDAKSAQESLDYLEKLVARPFEERFDRNGVTTRHRIQILRRVLKVPEPPRKY